MFQKQKKRFSLLLVVMMLFNLFSGVATVGYAESGLSSVISSEATRVTTMAAISVNQTKMVLPAVASGCGIKIKTSSNEAIIKLDGTIVPPTTDSKVNLVLKVYNLLNESESQDTTAIEVTVPRAVSVENLTYLEGSGNGRNGAITVKVGLDAKQVIKTIEVLSHKESATGYSFSPAIVQALELVPKAIIEKQSLTIDVVSSASLTSKGVIRAVADALKGTKYVEALSNKLWSELIKSDQETMFLTETKGKILHVGKKSSVSTITLLNSDGSVFSTTSGAAIDAGLKVGDTGAIILIGAKESSQILTSTDGGLTWDKKTPMSGISKEKVESLYLDGSTLYAVVNKYGLFASKDGGSNWENINGSIPKNPEKATEYDLRKLTKVDGKWYLMTKKQGLLVSEDLLTWSAVKANGLSTEGKDVWDLVKWNDSYYITGKGGVFKTNLKDDSDWTAVEGLTGEGRALLTANNQLYAIYKDLKVMVQNSGTWSLLSTFPSLLTGEDPKMNLYYNNAIYMGHKTGLARLVDATTIKDDSDNDTDGVSGATKSASDDSEKSGSSTAVAVNQTPTSNVSTMNIDKSETGTIKAKVGVKDLVFDASGKANLVVKDSSPIIKTAMDSGLVSRLVSENRGVSILSNEVEYTIPKSIFELAGAKKDLGNLKEIELTVEVLTPEKVSALGANVKLLTTPVDFNLALHYDNGSTTMNDFGSVYVERLLPLPTGFNKSNVTGVVYENNQWKSVPTLFKVVNGVEYASIKRNSNSIYSLAMSEVKFSDMVGHWAQNAVTQLANKMIIKGYNGKFNPNGSVTRAEFVSMLVSGLGLKATGTEALTYTDVKATDWYAGSLATASAYGLIEKGGAFKPNQKITREEMMVMLDRAYDFSAPEKVSSVVSSLYKDGTYTGTSVGNNGAPIEVKIVIEKGLMTTLEWTKLTESTSAGENAIKTVGKSVLAKQSSQVDTVSGATISSNKGLEAIISALGKAKNDVVSTNDTDKAIVNTKPISAFKDYAQIDVASREEVARQIAIGTVSGYSDETIRPKNSLTRAEAASVLVKLFKMLTLMSEE